MVADGGAMTSLCKAFLFVWQPESSTYRHTALPALLSLFASECVMTGEARVSRLGWVLGGLSKEDGPNGREASKGD